MFGNCPRTVWERWCPPDEQHRIDLACRCLLVQEGDRTVLLEAGIGAFFEPKMQSRYGVVESEHVLLDNLAAVGVKPEDVDVVVLSHLHFDHAGGLLTPYQPDTEPGLVFPNATYVVGAQAWARAQDPHPRDRASFIPALPGLLEGSGKLEVVQGERSTTLGDRYSFVFSDGHTPGLMLTRVEGPRGPVYFMGDLIPGVPWVHLPITMGYDRYPELVIDEKKKMLERVQGEDAWMFYTHDASTAASRLTRDERGRWKASDLQPEVNW